MSTALLSLALALGAGDDADSFGEKMLPIYRKEVEEYTIAVQSAPKKPLTLVDKPLLDWSNPVRADLQHGAVYLWLRDGRPAALGSIFTYPYPKLSGRKVLHEFHSLDREKLLVTRPDALNEWKPQSGLARKELPDAEAPGGSRGARLIQMRRLARGFTGHIIGREEDAGRWALRLLPAPLYRYPDAETGVVDGALFTLLTEGGTDPEVLLLLEAVKEGGQLRWEYALGRFSDRHLHVQRGGQEVWSSVIQGENTLKHDALHLYRNYADKVISPEGKLLARVRVTDKLWWGEVIPVEEE